MAGTFKNMIAVIAVVGAFASLRSQAKDLAITLPKRSELTTVQRLNREGVEAVNKNQYEKAEAIFYKAYLYDPADPFTLNNLGYIYELQGQLDRANKFYLLATQQGSNANIDRSNSKALVGKPMRAAFETLQDVPMRVNRMNVNAIQLLADNRGLEASQLLQKALALDPRNPFTQNNLGVADEAIGDYQGALANYASAAQSGSTEPVVVTLDRAWRGKPVNQMAADSEKRLQSRLQQTQTAEMQAVMFAWRGVAAENQNNWAAAKQNFLEAYTLDPNSAFSLNNRGYVAEREGDLETAQFFYEKARRAGNAQATVGLATQSSAEGKQLVTVAVDSNTKVDSEIDKYAQQRRRETGPIELTPRDNSSPQGQPTNPVPPQGPLTNGPQ
jgi:Flp pilus assembly protein TadD